MSKDQAANDQNELQNPSSYLSKKLKTYGFQVEKLHQPNTPQTSNEGEEHYNVVGKMRGMGKHLKKEYMLFVSSGNYDLKGRLAASAVLNMARSLKQLEPQLRRSLLFIFPASDGPGIRHWEKQTTIPMTQITAVLTFDAGRAKNHTLTLKGGDDSSIGDILKEEAHKRQRKVSSVSAIDKDSTTSIFAQFAKRGIPVVTVKLPLNKTSKLDTSDLKEAAKDLRICFTASYRIINQHIRQSWKDKAKYKKIRTRNFEQ